MQLYTVLVSRRFLAVKFVYGIQRVWRNIWSDLHTNNHCSVINVVQMVLWSVNKAIFLIVYKNTQKPLNKNEEKYGKMFQKDDFFCHKSLEYWFKNLQFSLSIEFNILFTCLVSVTWKMLKFERFLEISNTMFFLAEGQ